ncbi:phage repressor protein [Chryseobacterium mucoviscidosis]|nr:phage repressor protein [Chryseobacterium mucoviscidosis]
MRKENWLGHDIRFIETKIGKWGAVAVDACSALGIKNVTRAVSGLRKDGVHSMKVIDAIGREQAVNVIDERNIYLLIFKSRKREAERFQEWVFEVVEQLRQSTGLEGFQVFRMLDKGHQKEAMQKLRNSLKEPVRVDFIKANTIANKAVSSKYGHPKMIKKDQMTPDMLVSRQEILEDTVELMGTTERFGLNIGVSETIYKKHLH